MTAMWPDDRVLEQLKRAHTQVMEHAPLVTLEYVTALEGALVRSQEAPMNAAQAHAARVWAAAAGWYDPDPVPVADPDDQARADAAQAVAMAQDKTVDAYLASEQNGVNDVLTQEGHNDGNE